MTVKTILNQIQKEAKFKEAKVFFEGKSFEEIFNLRVYYAVTLPKKAEERFEKFKMWYEEKGYLFVLGDLHKEERELEVTLSNCKKQLELLDIWEEHLNQKLLQEASEFPEIEWDELEELPF